MYWRKKFKKIKRSFAFSIFVASFGITLFLLPPVLKILNDFYLQLNLRGRGNLNIGTSYGPILISPELTTINDVIGDYPVRIIIPQLKIDLPVKPSRIVGGVWEVHPDSANFGVGSALPKDKGNSVIFAHALSNLFAPLRRLKKEDLIFVQTKDGKWFSYKVVDKKEVNPTQIEFISQTSDKTLTLFTCSGFSDSKRLIVIAKEMIKG